MLLLGVLVAPGYVRLGVRPASPHARTTALARSDALPLEALEPPELPPQQAQQAQQAWAWDEHVQWTSGPVAPLPAEASPGTVVRLLHAAALGLMLFPPVAALLCLASYATTITLGITLGFRVARTQLLRNRWLRWYLLAETFHFFASKLTRWGQARPNPNPNLTLTLALTLSLTLTLSRRARCRRRACSRRSASPSGAPA